MTRAPSALAVGLAVILLVPLTVAAQEPAWVIEHEDATGDITDLDGGPVAGPGYMDLTKVRMEVEGDDLLVTFDFAEALPEDPADGIQFDILLYPRSAGDGMPPGDISARVEPKQSWAVEVWGPQPDGMYGPIGTATLGEARLAIRVPLSLVGSPGDIGFTITTEAWPSLLSGGDDYMQDVLGRYDVLAFGGVIAGADPPAEPVVVPTVPFVLDGPYSPVEADDPKGDVTDLSGNPAEDNPSMDLTRFQAWVEDEDLVVTWEVAEDLRPDYDIDAAPAFGLVVAGPDIPTGEAYIWVSATKGWGATEVSWEAALASEDYRDIPDTPLPAPEVAGRQVTARVPLSYLGSPHDLRLHARQSQLSLPDWISDLDAPEWGSVDLAALDAVTDGEAYVKAISRMTGARSWEDRVPDGDDEWLAFESGA